MRRVILRSIPRGLMVLAMAVSGPAAQPAPQNVAPPKAQQLAAAQQKYYNLRREGLLEFQSNIQPNWKVVLGDAQTDDTLKLLAALHFSMSIDAKSKLRLDHRADLTPISPKPAAAFEQIFKQMDEAVSRFIATWSIFMLTSPFPEAASDYEFEQKAGEFRFSQRHDDGRTLTITDKNFMITEITFFGPGFSASLKPDLENTSNGYVLTGYTGTYQTLSGARTTLLKVWLDYQQIEGLRLPRKVNVDTVYEGKAAQLEWLFTDYKVARASRP